MREYEGFQISCGCSCSRCSHALELEGVDDAGGSHYCRMCDDYVKPMQMFCKYRTPEKVAKRERIIKRHQKAH